MILELFLLAISNFVYGVARTWDIQNLSKGRATAQLFLVSLFNSSVWILSSYLGMKGMILDGSIAHGIVYALTAASSSFFMTWIRQKRENPDGTV